MALAPIIDRSEVGMKRAPLAYSAAERKLSQFVQRRMYELLRGERDCLILARRYWSGKRNIAFPLPPDTGPGVAAIRPEIGEAVVDGLLQFFDPFSPGGPIVQTEEGKQLLETQTFPTQYPHIVIERTDAYRAADRAPIYTEWKALRLQNQRRSTLVNRAIDMGNLAFELARFLPAL